MIQLFEHLEISAESAAWIASGLRALASCDGFHTAELALVEEFERGLGIEASSRGDFDARTSPLQSTEEREVFVCSLQLMSLADGRQSSREEEWIVRTSECLGVSEARRLELEVDAKKFLLSSLSGVTTFRAQAVSIGQSLGLSDAVIDEVLG
jgi:hypothetical protein